MSTTDTQTGVFAGPIRGLRFETPTRSGITNDRGEFQYGAGECVTFSIGGLVLGSIDGAPRVNLAQLVNRADGKVDRLHDPMVTNPPGSYRHWTRTATSRTASRSRRSCTI